METLSLMDFLSGEFWQKVTLSAGELGIAQGEITLPSLGPWLGVGFWLLLLAMPLSRIHRKDQIVGATYVLYLMASSTVIILLFCGPWVGQGLSSSVAALLLSAGTVAAWRWRQAASEAVPLVNKGDAA